MAKARAAGILLHPTSLPGHGGIGSVGANAYQFVDLLKAAGIRLWQVLPLGPTGYGDSPYAGLSAFAGNPLLIGLDTLINDDLLSPSDLESAPHFPESRVEFGIVGPWKMDLLRKAFDRFQNDDSRAPELEGFALTNAHWLQEFVLFAALKDHYGGAPWWEWDEELRRRNPTALERARRELATDVALHTWGQYTFFGQWQALKQYANRHGVRLIGDIPIFVAYDSADVWAHQNLFRLSPDGTPEVVAGVPPDYFSRTGQLWGNPHYRWDAMASDGFQWWIDRFQSLQQLVDIVRLDHFRGFAAAWQVPFGNPTAERGEWVDGPRQAFFDAVQAAVKDLEIIAEDLGVITPDVVELRNTNAFPGMQILQFAFSTNADDPTLPHNYVPNTVVYSGTHDNDTTVGWWAELSADEQQRVKNYVQSTGIDIAWDLLHLALASVARYAIVPLQDVLRLGTAARMNRPGRPDGNWNWRFKDGDVTPAHITDLRFLSETYGRVNKESDARLAGE